MKILKKTFLPMVLLAAILLCLAGCMPEFVDAKDYIVYEADSAHPVKRLTTVVTADTISQLDDYPDLEKLDLTGSTCYPEILAYVKAHPQVDVKYTVNVLGKEYGMETISINLSNMESNQVPQVAALLPHLKNLRYVELMRDDNTSILSLDDVKKIQLAIPKVPLNYTIDLFGTKVSMSASAIELKDVKIYDSGLPQIRAAIEMMPGLKSVRLDNCGTTSEAMDQLRKDYPHLNVAWRIWFGKYTCMTDEEVLRLTNGLQNEHIGEMKYLTNAKYVDIGHNETLSDISFFEYMPKVKLIIGSGTAISDVSALRNCKELEFLELVFCSYLKDISPLSGCTGLKFLNISITSVKDLSPLKDIPLERMVALQMKYLQQSERESFRDSHPDCLRVWYGTQPYGYGWRYSDQGYTFYKYYAEMREIFDYDDKYKYTGRYYTGKRIEPETKS